MQIHMTERDRSLLVAALMHYARVIEREADHAAAMRAVPTETILRRDARDLVELRQRIERGA